MCAISPTALKLRLEIKLYVLRWSTPNVLNDEEQNLIAIWHINVGKYLRGNLLASGRAHLFQNMLG